MTSRKPSALEMYLNQNNRQPSPNRQNPHQVHQHTHTTQDSYTWQTNFIHSKNQCLNELSKLIRKVDRQQSRVRAYMKDYQLGVLERLDTQYRALKAELCRILDGAYERCIIKVKQGFLGEEMGELERALKRLEQIRQKIRTFEFELETNYTYKKGIAHVVMQNFEAQRAELVGNMNAALKSYEGKIFLRVEPHEFAKMKEALANLFTYTGNERGSQEKRRYESPRMFPVPETNILKPIPNLSYEPITAVNEGLVPNPQLVPPFKPFPPRRSDSYQDPPSNQNIQEKKDEYPSGIRYTAPNPDFDEIFYQQSPKKVENQQELTYKQHYIPPQPSGLQNRSPSPNAHRNRDLIRQSKKSNQ